MRLWLDGLLRDAARRPVVVVCTLLLALAGCKPAPEVSKYTAPYEAVDTSGPAPDPAEDPKSGERILGLIAPGGTEAGEPRWWFFKMRGRPQAVGLRVKPLEAFAASLKFPPGEAIPTFDLPPGWQLGRATNELTLMSVRTGHPYTPLNMDISRLGGDLGENINRWRKQVGLPELPADEVLASVREVTTADGKKVYWVDVSGPGGPKAPFAKHP
jgi:hypothetical protein